MKIIISFDTDNASFQDYPHGDGDFDGEIRRVLKQAEDYLLNKRDSDALLDINGNVVGNIFRSTPIRRRMKE